MDFLIKITLQILVGLFLCFVWKLEPLEIGFWRWMIGWVVGMVFVQNIDNIAKIIKSI